MGGNQVILVGLKLEHTLWANKFQVPDSKKIPNHKLQTKPKNQIPIFKIKTPFTCYIQPNSPL